MATSHADGDPLIQELEELLSAGVLPADATYQGAAASGPAVSPAALSGLLPRYRLGSLIGAGGMGQVFHAHDTLLNRHVAIKVVSRPGPVVADLMRRERQVLAALEHRSIVAVYDCGELAQGEPYYVMQYVQGEDLRAYVAERGLSLREKLGLVAEIARAVGVAHLLKVVHRDLKPSNIKVTSGGRPMILDFGLAKFASAHDSDDAPADDTGAFQTVAHGRVKGTLAYMSPEQAAGETVDCRTDVYSLGVILHELITGRLPRDPDAEGSTPLDWSRRLRSTSPNWQAALADDLPGPVRAILERALDADAARRYPSGIELADDLDAYLQNRPVAAVRRRRRWHLARAFAARNRRAIAIAAVIFSVLASIVATAFIRIREERNLAEQNARRAIDRENATRRFLYAADLGQAHRLWHNQQLDKAQALLDRYRPAAHQSDLRTFEWRFLEKLCANRPLTLTGHAADVTAVRYAPDGRRLASADAAGGLRVWDARSGASQQAFSANSSLIKQIGFLPNGNTLFSIGHDRNLRLWDLASGSQARSYWWFWRRPSAAACSPDGQRIAVADDGGHVYLWNTQTGAVLGQFLAHSARGARSVAFSPDGSMLATGGKDQAARVWNAETFELKVSFEPHFGPIDALCFSADSARLATGGTDRSVRVWRLDAPATPEFQSFGGDEIVGIGFGEQADTLWVARKNGTINYVNSARHERTALHTDTARLRSASVTSDLGQIASASGDRTIQLWRPEQLAEHRHLACDPQLRPLRLALAPGEDLMAVLYSDQPLVDVWDVSAEKRVVRLSDFARPVTAVAFSQDGKSLFTTDMAGKAQAWQVGTWRPAYTLAADGVFKSALAVSPRDGCCAVGDANGRIVCYDSHSSRPMLSLKGHDNMPVVDLSFSADGRWLASSGWDKTIHLWDVANGQLVHVLRGHQSIVQTVRFAPDGQRLASTSADGTVRLWNRQSGAEETTLWRLPHETHGLCFTSDGRTLAASSADRNAKGLAQVCLWNVDTLQETLTLEVGGSQILALCFSAHDDRLFAGVTAGSTGAGLIIWEAKPAASAAR